MRRYGAHDWRSEPTNLLITSPTGGSRAYLVCAIGIAARERGHDVVHLRMGDPARRHTTNSRLHPPLLPWLLDQGEAECREVLGSWRWRPGTGN